jgi:hypothetical protein
MNDLVELKTWDGCAWAMENHVHAPGVAWARIQRSDWLLGLTDKLDVKLDESKLRLFACDCALRVLPFFESVHPQDRRPHLAIEMAQRFARGGATIAEMAAAGNATWAAVWAAGAAARAAGAKTKALGNAFSPAGRSGAVEAARETAQLAAAAAAGAAAGDATGNVAWAAAWSAAWDAVRASIRDKAKDMAWDAVWDDAWGAEARVWQADLLRSYFPNPF